MGMEPRGLEAGFEEPKTAFFAKLLDAKRRSWTPSVRFRSVSSLPNSMSRVAWRSLAQRSNFDFMHTASGRLHADQLMQRSTVGWAVCGRADFVKGVVPAMRTAGISVRALSVVPANFHNVTCRLRAQDAQDVLCRTLNIPEGVSVEALKAQEGFEYIMVEAGAEKWPEEHSTALKQSGKQVVCAPVMSESDMLADYLNRWRFDVSRPLTLPAHVDLR